MSRNDNLKFEVFCDNKKSFSISLVDADRVSGPKRPGKPAVLVRCDREDYEDNDRGLQLANKVKDFLNTLPQEEIRRLVADESIPPLF